VDATETLLVFDVSGLTLGTFQKPSIFLLVEGINFKTAVWEEYSSGAWNTVATLDASTGLASMLFSRAGDIITPGSGSAYKATRYLHTDDLAGGTAVLEGDAYYRRIAANSEGAWTDETVARPAIRLKGVTDAEATTGALELWTPSVCAVVHEYSSTARYHRLRIPAQTTADGDFRLGQLVLGHLHVLGQQHSRAWAVRENITHEVRSLRNGSSRAVKRGPTVREVEIQWADGVDATAAQAASPTPDYVTGSTSGIPLASPAATLLSLPGLVSQIGGAATPVVWFPSVTRASGATILNNPRSWLYGRIESAQVGTTNVLGEELHSELNRGESVVIREIV